MKASNLLPIGSVITVKEANKKMMIIGILQKSKDTKYDYMAVLYPEGYLTQKQIYLFNHEDIEEVHFLGFMGVDYQVFRNNLVNILEDIEEAESEE
ncbi:MAG: DUF4176 domain-containing protein [Lachnospiraceae bacterium]|jgi:hypothetical protein|nr:DUF4176 domain-containing protein [Lachnospiraceae bacterium]MBR6526976.1 DUF4176 domain-containing protein [Lachnospiraceae bacterium]